jgi:electron transport complex protein RnfC
VISRSASHYPIGLPVPLIKAATGREVPLPYGQPRDVGVALFDLATTLAVGTAVSTQRPQTELMITVGGGALSRSGLITALLGTPIQAVIEAAGGYATEPAKLIVGGPMTGVAHYDTAIPLTKEVTGLFALSAQEITLTAGYRECINCGRCVAVCPVNLVPGMLSLYCAKERFDTAAHQGLLSCIECGCCDYVCPSRRPLVHLFRHAKHQLMEGKDTNAL